MPLDVIIEGILFYRSSPVKISELKNFCVVEENELNEALETLSNRLTGGVRLITTENEVVLATAPELADTINTLRTADSKKDIGKAGGETLAIVLYRGPISRTEIDRIRGVNSGYILRNLAIRGLIERTTNAKKVEYICTPSLLRHLGITSRQNLPEFDAIMNQLTAYEATRDTVE